MRNFLKFFVANSLHSFPADVTNIEFMSFICLPLHYIFNFENIVNIFTLNISSPVV